MWFKTEHSHQTAIVVLSVVNFSFDNLREKRSVPVTKWSIIACFKNSCSTPFQNCWPRPINPSSPQFPCPSMPANSDLRYVQSLTLKHLKAEFAISSMNGPLNRHTVLPMNMILVALASWCLRLLANT